MEWNALVPELIVASYAASKAFYVNVFGFSLRFERPENNFGYFDLGAAQIMLVEDVHDMVAPGVRGKGVHFQVEVPSASVVLERLERADVPLVAPLAEAWYRQDDILHGHREFFVCDPDGYLYRFYEYIGQRNATDGSPDVG